jgi:hypothetical protein
MSVSNLIAGALYSKLTTGTALTALLAGTTSVYNLQAPDGATFDYVVFSLQAGGPSNITPSDLREEVYYIRAYSDTSAGKAGSIDAQISALLHHGTISVSGYTTWAINRESDYQLIENPPSGKPIYTAGGSYRIYLDAS